MARENGDVLMTAGQGFKDDVEIVTEAVKTSVDALLWASPALRENKQVLLTAVAANGRALRYTQGLRNDKDVVLAAVAQDGDALQFAAGLRGDKEVVVAACRQTGWALQYASDALRDDAEVVRVAANQDPNAVRCASDRLCNNSAVIEEQRAAGMRSDAKGGGSGGKLW